MSVFHDKFQEKLAEGLASLTLRCISGLLTVVAGVLAYLDRNNPTALVVFVAIAICSLILLVVIFSLRKRVHPADVCLYCRQQTGQIVSHLGPGNLTRDWAGREAYIYKCSNPKCSKSYGREVKPAA